MTDDDTLWIMLDTYIFSITITTTLFIDFSLMSLLVLFSKPFYHWFVQKLQIINNN